MGNLGDEKQGTGNDEGRKSDDVWYWVGGAVVLTWVLEEQFVKSILYSCIRMDMTVRRPLIKNH